MSYHCPKCNGVIYNRRNSTCGICGAELPANLLFTEMEVEALDRTASGAPPAYFIILDDDTKGPYTIRQLRSMWAAGQLTAETLYCEEGYDNWLHLRVLADELEPETPRLSPQTEMLLRREAMGLRSNRSRGVYIILGLLLGVLGIHNFYAGHNRAGAWQLIITVSLGWMLIGLIITGVWVLFEVCSVTEDGAGFKLT